MTDAKPYDAVIIGGGPAGASAAAILARLGRHVLVVEKERFPRHHIGESMVLGVRNLLRALGVADRMEEAGFVHKAGSTHVWGHAFDVWRLYFSEAAPGAVCSYQVDRSVFDDILLRYAADCGADVWQCVTVTDVSLDDPDEVVVTYQADGRVGHVRGNYLIDATGQRRFLAQRKHLGKTIFDPLLHNNMAVYSYYADGRLQSGVNNGNLLLESFPQGWAWHIPLHIGCVSVGLVVGADSLHELRATGPDGFLADQIPQTIVLRELLAGANSVTRARVINNGSYQVDRIGGDRYLLAGDAGGFIDPLFSPGTLLALQSGMYAAMCINFALRFPDRWPEVCSLYEREISRAYRHARQAVQLNYSSNDLFKDSPFWRDRKLSNEQVEAMAADPDFLHTLQPEGTLAYERLALDHADLPPSVATALARADRRREERISTVDTVMQDLGGWALQWHPLADYRYELGFPRLDESFDIVEGVMAQSEGGQEFISNPLAIRALERIDGGRSLRELISDLLQTVPEQRRFLAQMGLLHGFGRGFRRHLFEAVRVSEPARQSA